MQPKQLLHNQNSLNLSLNKAHQKFSVEVRKELSQVAGNVIFADIIGSANDNDDMQIRCSAGTFTPSNKRKGVKGTSGQGTQRRNTWDLSFRLDDATTKLLIQ